MPLIRRFFYLLLSALSLVQTLQADTAPQQRWGIQSGDVTQNSAIIWGRSDRPARMQLEISLDPSFKDARILNGPAALVDSDYTAKMAVNDLPPGQKIHYRVRFIALQGTGVISEALNGSFRTAPDKEQDIRFLWSGDTAGQGWGINEDWGGMKIYQQMREVEPHFFIHSGDAVYADNPLPTEQALPLGGVWKNLIIPEKTKVAETLNEFRGNYRYNLLDTHVRRFNAEVPVYYQWDDHETTNNWYPQEILQDPRYKEKSVALLAARAKQAFSEYTPMRYSNKEEKIYRHIDYGPAMDLFLIDMRSYRGPNSPNRQPQQSAATALLGETQINWLKQALLQSDATWKVIASDMPIGIQVRDKKNFENMANGNGPALGRELEFAGLLRFIKTHNIQNVVFFTADVHYTAAHYYDPEKAQFQDFLPFWEFVSGPLNAGTFGPGKMDNTFGPQVRFFKAPPKGRMNLPPTEGYQFFGQVDIAAGSHNMQVQLKDLYGKSLYRVKLEPQPLNTEPRGN